MIILLASLADRNEHFEHNRVAVSGLLRKEEDRRQKAHRKAVPLTS